MINFTVYSADCVGNSGNCLYPNKMIVADKESFIAATKMDHVTAKYKGNYRSKDNFEYSDCIPLDCDNDHSENPDEWVTPLDIALEIPGVAFAVSYSRHHNLPKGYKSARPRFHIFFPIKIVSDEQEYADMAGAKNITVIPAKKRVGNTVTAEDKYYPEGISIDTTYSEWCSGKISTEQFLKERSKM